MQAIVGRLRRLRGVVIVGDSSIGCSLHSTHEQIRRDHRMTIIACDVENRKRNHMQNASSFRTSPAAIVSWASTDGWMWCSFCIRWPVDVLGVVLCTYALVHGDDAVVACTARSE